MVEVNTSFTFTASYGRSISFARRGHGLAANEGVTASLLLARLTMPSPPLYNCTEPFFPISVDTEITGYAVRVWNQRIRIIS